MFEQEGVVLQVFIRQVVLDLGDQLLDELRVWGLPALLLQLASAGPGAAVCVSGKNTCITVSTESLVQLHNPQLPTLQLLHFH